MILLPSVSYWQRRTDLILNYTWRRFRLYVILVIKSETKHVIFLAPGNRRSYSVTSLGASGDKFK